MAKANSFGLLPFGENGGSNGKNLLVDLGESYGPKSHAQPRKGEHGDNG
jgi:hypothetical protein